MSATTLCSAKAGFRSRALHYYQAYWRQGLGNWTPGNCPARPEELRLLQRHLRPGMTVLDVGCGDGRLAGKVLELGANYVGVDLAFEAAAACRKRGAVACVADVEESLPFREAQFHVVLGFELLEHLFLPERCLSDIRRILRPDGWLVGSVPNIAFWPNRLLMACGYFNPGGSPYTSLDAPWRDPHLRFFTFPTLRRLFRDAGFTQCRLTGEHFHWSALPVLYRLADRAPRRLAGAGLGLGWLGRLWPTLFAPHIYFEVQHGRSSLASHVR
ncbi:MAG: class I SAM-dependent methyltransferase [Bryobacterales bacterium]|nr:class I SAM-dependent methyltransferase [Bryobacteraceae bacterium]MDW8355185.1 class I SAM-dependent methyltransferase [Bryobacterales bacterium]